MTEKKFSEVICIRARTSFGLVINVDPNIMSEPLVVSKRRVIPFSDTFIFKCFFSPGKKIPKDQTDNREWY